VEPCPVAMALTPQVPPRGHRPLCLSVSSDSSGRFRALDSLEWRDSLKAQVETVYCSPVWFHRVRGSTVVHCGSTGSEVLL